MPSQEQEAKKLAQAGLTQRQKECLILYCYDCRTMDDIAEILGLSKPVVSRHIQAGTKKLAAAGMKIRRLQSEPEITNMDIDRLGPDEIRAVW